MATFLGVSPSSPVGTQKVTLTTAQAPSIRRLTNDEIGLLERLREAIGKPLDVYYGVDKPVDSGEGDVWLLDEEAVLPAHPAHPSRVPAPGSLLSLAAQSDGPVATYVDDDALVAIRVGPRSRRVAVAHGKRQDAEWLRRLLQTASALHRAGASALSLNSENDLFAAQLASDLEELSFLRSMVESLTRGRADDDLTSLVDATLPVLNTTVRACCLAFMSLPDPQAPYAAEVGVAVGSAPINGASLSEVVRRFGPGAARGPLVKNWDVTNLPDAATLWDDTEMVPGVHSLVIAPLSSGERMLGWLVAINREPSGDLTMQRSWQLCSDEFGSGEATLIATTASILATHAANLDLVREKERLMVSMVRALVSAIESKDQYTRGHSERVALYTRRLAEQIGYDEKSLENIYLSAVLHDVGKIGVRDAVLRKAGKLTDEEFAEIACHPDEGWAILCDIEQLGSILPGVLHHHERWDGRGYPDGLAGRAIPLDGRILSVADAYDAMTSDRPYRMGMPSEKAEAILREGAGVQWDPDCIEAFLGCIDEIRRIKATYRLRERKSRKPQVNPTEPLAPETADESGSAPAASN